MKSVKSKLFVGFSAVIFIILLALSILAIKLFSFSQKNELFEKIEQTMYETYSFVESNSDNSIQELERQIQLHNQFVIILKNERVLYSSESDYKTHRILEETYDELDDDDERYEERHEHYKENHFSDKKRKSHRNKDESFDKELFSDDDYLIAYDDLIKDENSYEIIVGVDEKLFNHHMDDIALGIFLFVLIIFLILLGLGYVLISRTIKPLKLVLDEVQALRDGNDLSKRLNEPQTKDEFESLVVTLNEMLGNIERSVENIKQFSSDASHELKTPLTIIQGEIELTKNKSMSVEQLQEVISKIDKEQKKLQEIIQNFLLLSRLEKESMKDAKTLLDMVMFESVESNLEALEKKGLELKLDIDEGLEVNFEHRYLLIVLNNLLSNAIKYTNEGTISLKAFNQNGQTQFMIEDSGIGIDKVHQGKIFERFFRVDKARSEFSQGVGLGLSIVKKICDRFNTTIELESQLGEGTQIVLKFD